MYRAFRVDSDGEAVCGFVGCGHGATYAIYRGGEKVGDLYASRNGGMYDLAFYDITPGTTLSNVTSYSGVTGGSNETVSLSPTCLSVDDEILVGSTVMKVGSRTFYSQGQILCTEASYSVNFVSYNNFIKTTALNLVGDSGGAAFIYYGGAYRIIGTMSASDYSTYPRDASTFICSYIASYRHSVNALGFTIYHY